ncbi:MAG: aminoacyl-histidine dipeptidase [Ignavibacteriaceae bacterium]|nr:aminoacyl-histidine dipeptidase [Ignavibacteriaceae bacterium]
MSGKLAGLKPEKLWQIFEEISNHPRPSKKEEKVVAYVLDFAKKHNLNLQRDEAGNIVIKVPATPGYENRKTTVLQAHLDMVCEKNKGVNFDFDNDPIDVYEEDGWVKARGTTLGADNGIGAAAAMAVPVTPGLEHGPLELLFTLDEETGLTGANNLSTSLLEGEILLNLDSEEEGAIYIGCSGGRDTRGKFRYTTVPAPANYSFVEIFVSGLKGGHSGLDIHTGRGNAIKFLTRILKALDSKENIVVSSINGGSKRNAIPREAEAIIGVENSKIDALKKDIAFFKQVFRGEIANVEPGLDVVVKDVAAPAAIISDAVKNRLIHALYALPHGVIKMSGDIPGLVETSTNLAIVNTLDGVIEIGTSQRSSVASEIEDAVQTVVSVLLLAGAEVETLDGYPGWKPDLKSQILVLLKERFQAMYNQEPEVKAIHAGLECGILKEKYASMDIVSFGPTITGAHSPDEQVNVKSVENFWILLTDVLKHIPGKN